MKGAAGLVLALVLVVPAGLAAGDERGTVYGKGVSIETPTPLTELLADPARFEGRTVRVDGIVSAVCDGMGCWIELAESADAARGVRFKVDDGVIVFPVSAKGRRAAAQGVVRTSAPGHDPHHASTSATGGNAHESHAAHAHHAAPAVLVEATGAIVY